MKKKKFSTPQVVARSVFLNKKLQIYFHRNKQEREKKLSGPK